jgi:hypothetical protein
MNAYRKIKFTTPAQIAGQIAGIIGLYAAALAIIIFFI